MVGIVRFSVIERLMACVEFDLNTGCWLWAGCTRGKGYGYIGVGTRACRAHRVSYELHKGPITDGLLVLHKCDTPACVNPDHLFLGTQQENMADKAKKGRAQRGTRSHFAKLTDEIVREIYLYPLGNGVTQTDLAKKYGVTKVSIGNIRKGNAWRHVTAALELPESRFSFRERLAHQKPSTARHSNLETAA